MRYTIADIRYNSLNRFNEAYIHDINKASYIINSYYRLCGLSNRLLILDNDERTYNTRYTTNLHAREDRHINRLNEALKPYGLCLMFFSWLPSICIKDDSGNKGTRVYEPTFYN